MRAVLLAACALAAACASSGSGKGPGVWVSDPPAAEGSTARDLQLQFKVDAEPIRIGSAWGIAIRVTAENITEGDFEIAGNPPLRVTGHQMTRDDEEISFDDGCSATIPEPIRLGFRDRTKFKRTYGHGTDEALRAGERVSLDLAICHVKTPAGTRVRSMPVAQVVMVAKPAGEPEITISAPQPADR
ncbi:MAG: hypothetical protein R3F39_23485 [Myxococcota bacterium]